MVINEYVKRWCDEDYDVRHEDFFVENAYYVSEKEWAIHGFRHGLVGGIIALAVLFFARAQFLSALSLAISILGIFTACFYIFAMKEYDAHSVAGYIFYGVMATFLVISLFVMPDFSFSALINLHHSKRVMEEVRGPLHRPAPLCEQSRHA